MYDNPFAGVALHAVGGVAHGTFYAPLKKVRNWAWESAWLVQGVAAWIITPWLVSQLCGSHPWQTLSQSSAPIMLRPFLFGMVWGAGSLTFGLKCLIRGVGRDNEEAVIGTQLRFGDKRLPRGSAGRGWRTLIAPLQYGSGNREIFSTPHSLTSFRRLLVQRPASRARCGILHALRRAGTVPNAGVRYGPGSAAHRSAKCYALRGVRGHKSCRIPPRLPLLAPGRRARPWPR